MERSELHDFEFALIKLLLGKMNLFQEQGEREVLVEDSIKELVREKEYAFLKEYFVDTESKVAFIKEFLSYVYSFLIFPGSNKMNFLGHDYCILRELLNLSFRIALRTRLGVFSQISYILLFYL